MFYQFMHYLGIKPMMLLAPYYTVWGLSYMNSQRHFLKHISPLADIWPNLYLCILTKYSFACKFTEIISIYFVCLLSPGIIDLLQAVESYNRYTVISKVSSWHFTKCMHCRCFCQSSVTLWKMRANMMGQPFFLMTSVKSRLFDS